MKVRNEIEKYASEEDKPILLWLFERNHMESHWRYVARCTWEIDPQGTSQHSCFNKMRVWKPTSSGYAIYRYAQIIDLLEDAPCECDGIGVLYHDENNIYCFKTRAGALLRKDQDDNCRTNR